MTPSLEIREHAAKLFTEAWAWSDRLNAAEDNGASEDLLADLDGECAQCWQDYSDFCDFHEFELLTEASGSVLRCAETNIPLCDLDECIETETGQLMIVKQAA